ncbi:MAG: hypothetical protein M3R30_06845, partial [Candidatus Eremiobacteraeota bacterium]|nr:hypothetical protein [Candidatus Eremiobacteraeota bacterium]
MTALIDLYKAESHRALVEFIVREYGIAKSQTVTSTHEMIAAAVSQVNNDNPHRRRREEMAQRVRLYRDDYAKDIGDVIDTIWQRPDYREKLKGYLGLTIQGAPAGNVALAQNVTLRLVNEVASLYDKPAVRIVSTEKGKQAAFKAEEKRLRLHELTQDYHRLLWLCNEVLVWLYMGVDGKTKLRVVTPDLFDAIPHPGDKTVMAGVLMQSPRVSMMPAQQAAAKLPVFEIWDDTYR